MTNAMIVDIWNDIVWNVVSIHKRYRKDEIHLPYKQVRILPTISKSNAYKKSLRDKYIEGWEYAAHWVDGNLKTAFSIIESWKSNYKKGRRGRNMPIIHRQFVRAKNDLVKLDGNVLRITIKPRQWLTVDLSNRHFKLGYKLGEITITPLKIYLPFHYPNPTVPPTQIGWDSNKLSLDGFSPETGWIKVDLHGLQTIHKTYHDKYRHINKVYAKNKNAGKRLYVKYKRRERNRTNQFLRKVAKYIAINFNAIHGFEKLAKQRMFKHNYHRWNRELADTDWRKILFFVSQYAHTKEVEPYYTSKTCSRCGGLDKALRGEKVFKCKQCGLKIDRQFNAAINLYQRMRGASHDITWFDLVVFHGGLPLIEAEMNPSDEPEREGDELMMPQIYRKLPNFVNYNP